jgi:hypothetical protein
VLIVTALVLLPASGGSVKSCFAQNAVSAPAATAPADANNAYVNSVNQYRDSLQAYQMSIEANAPAAMPTPDLCSMQGRLRAARTTSAFLKS